MRDVARVALLSCLLVAMAPGCGPSDGVQSYTFALLPVSEIVLPDANELGRELRPLDFGAASGRVTGTPATHALGFTLSGLPSLGLPQTAAYYRFTLTLGDAEIVPASSAARLLRALWPEGQAFAHAGAHGEILALFDTSEAGKVEMHPDPRAVALERATGAVVELVVPVGSGLKIYKLLEGDVGNLPSPVGEAAPAPTHSH